MSEHDINQLIDAIPDGQPATITVTDSAGGRIHLQGTFKTSQAPYFFFHSLPELLPDALDASRQCPFTSQDSDAGDVSFIADIVEIVSDKILKLVVKKTVRTEELRQFFRVTLRVGIIIRFYPENPDSNQREWQMKGETIDISQSGVLAILPEECRNSSGLDFEIALINPGKKVFCTGHVIRSKRLKKDRWVISFHFDEISAADRDAIAKNCFAEQRRQLRDKGQTF